MPRKCNCILGTARLSVNARRCVNAATRYSVSGVILRATCFIVIIVSFLRVDQQNMYLISVKQKQNRFDTGVNTSIRNNDEIKAKARFYNETL